MKTAKGFLYLIPIRIGKPNSEAQSYLCNPHARWFSVVKEVLQMPKNTISGSSSFDMIKLNWKVENERQKKIKSNEQLGCNLTAV